MDTFREIFDAMNSRIRSPIFGSIAIASAIANWKPLFYLAFAKVPVADRFSFVDEHATFWLGFFWPVVLGFAFAMASPWVALFSAWAAEEPTKRRKIRQTKSADKILTEKLKLEKTRIQFMATEEEAIIDAAKRDEKVKEISDPEIRGDLQRQIDELRESTRREISKAAPKRPEIDPKQTALEDTLRILREEREASIKAEDNYRTKQLNDRIDLIIGQLSNFKSTLG